MNCKSFKGIHSLIKKSTDKDLLSFIKFSFEELRQRQLNKDILKYSTVAIEECCKELNFSTSWDCFGNELFLYSIEDKEKLLEELQERFD